MTTAYTSLLGLALPVTGELSGTWGDTVNDYITQYLDASVAGTQTISGSQTAVTLSKTTNASLSQAGSGATGSSQYNVINCTGNPASMLTVTVPAASKTYVVVNATSTNQDVKIVGAGPTTGVTLVAGERAIIAWNGSDFIKVATSTADGVTTLSFGSTGLTPSTATSGAVTVAGTLVAANGGTGQSTYTTGDLLYATGSTALSKLGIGTNGQILTSTGTAPQWSTLSGVAVTTFSAGTTGFTPSSATSGAVTLAGTLATTNGGTGLTSFTANGVVYASSSSALTTGSALSFDGTNLGLSNSAAATVVKIDGSGRYKQFETYSSGTRQFYIGWDNTSQVANITNDNNYPILFSITGSEQMRLTSTGLGIGTSSPAYKLETVSPAGDYTTALFRSGDTTAANNTGGGFRNNSSATASSRFAQIWLDADGANLSGGDYFFIEKRGNSGTVDFLQYSNAAMRFGTNYTNRATIDLTLDSSGNLGLGVTPGGWTTYSALELGKNGGGYIGNTASGGFIGIGNNFYFNGSYRYANNAPASFYYQQSGNHYWNNAVGAASGTAFTFTQAMTLDASGNLLVGQTSAGLADADSITLSKQYGVVYVNHLTGQASGAQYAIFGYAGGSIGSITQNGTTAVAYNTSSDYRLKDNPQPLTGSGAFIDALQPKTWNWKADGSKGVGFIAHEVQEVSPGSVVGTKDAVDEEGKPIMQAMEYGSAEFIANIIAELQSLRARVAQLEGASA